MVWFCHKLKDSGQAEHGKKSKPEHNIVGSGLGKEIRIKWKEKKMH